MGRGHQAREPHCELLARQASHKGEPTLLCREP
jgi:hypothetical protein